MKCKRCRRDIPDNSIYCNWCGHQQLTASREVRVPLPKNVGNKWSAQLMVDGKRMFISADSEEEYYAKAKAAKSGLIEIKKAAPKLALGTAIDTYLNDNKNLISPSTLNNYRSYRRTRFPEYMGMDVSDINWQQMVNKEAEDYAPKTIINAWDLVCLSMEYAGRDRPKVKLPKKRKAKRSWLDYEQIQTFLGAIRGKPYELGALLALHGLRRSELLFLSAEDINLDNETIYIHGATVIGEGNKKVDKEYGKTSASTRTVHIVIPRITDLVKNMEGRLITTNPTTLYGSINCVCRNAGLPEVGVHGLRHSFASLAYHLKWSEMTTMREGGWSDPKVVHEIYTHLAEQDANADIQAMRDFYAAKQNY